MKLRRALAVAAATAVIAPAALMAAPAAYADGHDGTTSGTSETTPDVSGDDTPETPETPEVPETPDDTPGDTPGDSGDEQAITPDEDQDKAGDDTAAEEKPEGAGDDTAAEEKPDDTGDDTTPEDRDKPEDGEAPSEDDDYAWPVDECEIVGEDEEFTSSFNGLPEQVSAGSGWKRFSLDVTNGSDTDRVFTQAHVFLGAVSETGDATRYVTLQVQDRDGQWHDVSTDYEALEYGVVGQGRIGAGETVGIQLRLSVDAAAPDSVGFVLGYAFYLNEDEETCSETPVGDVYMFEIIAAGQKPNGNDAKPQGGKKKLPAKPAGAPEPEEDLEFEGQLAETGSSSALPMFALAGAAAVALGAGAVFVVRRRAGAGTDTSATA